MRITQNSWSSLLRSEIISNLTIPSVRTSISRSPLRLGFLLTALALALTWLALSPTATAQAPGTWTATGSMSIGRHSFTATLLTNGKVLVAGGGGITGAALSSAELYDLGTGAWVSTGSMTTPRAAQTANLLPDGKVLVAGGANDTGATSSAEIYDPSTGLWTLTGSMNTPRVAQMATLIATGTLSGMVIVAGGSSTCGGVYAHSRQRGTVRSEHRTLGLHRKHGDCKIFRLALTDGVA